MTTALETPPTGPGVSRPAGAHNLIDKPGLYQLTADEYHADPVKGGSLSSSGARRLLPPSCPAVFHYELTHPRPPKREFDFGHAAHAIVLGTGPELVAVDADDWRTKAAKEAAQSARDEGAVPLLTHEYEQVYAMATALRGHPIAGRLFNPEHGAAEQALVWQDETTGVWRRALLDWLPDRVPGRRLIVPDYKTARSAEPTMWAKAAADYGYHQQAAWYLDGVMALCLDEQPAFVFVVQEKSPPHLVTVVELAPMAMDIGRYLNRQGMAIYAECRRTNVWPGYASDVEMVPLPYYYERQFEDYLT